MKLIYKLMALSFSLFFISQVYANTAKEQESAIWGSYVISEPIEPSGENRDIGLVDDVFKNKTISIDGSHVVVGDLCNYKFSKEELTPIAYWNSKGSVKIYKGILEKYNVGSFSKVELFTPMEPSNKCPYPFSYFIKINKNLIFTQSNRLVIYSQGVQSITEGECAHKKQTLEQVYENGDINTCKFKGVNVVDAYNKYRKNANNINASTLSEEISPNKDNIIKCDSGCIEINYIWNGPDHLVVKQQFEGGETVVSFDKKDFGVLVEEKSFSD